MSWTTKLELLLGAATLLACGGDGYDSPTAPDPTPQVVTVEVNDNSFNPRQVTINPGDTVRWVLRGASTDHNVTAQQGGFNAYQFATAGSAYEVRFDTANRTHDYSCTAHAACCDMRGSVRVGESAPPYGY